MVGGEDGETRRHAAHWERRRVGVDRKGGFGVRWGRRKVGKGVRRRKAEKKKEAGRE